MATEFNMDKAKEVIDGLKGQAEDLVKDPSKVEELLQKLEAKLKDVPTVGEHLARLPLMISMIRSYIRKEYTNVSNKVIVTMVAAVLYPLVGKDIIPDKAFVIGYIDDIAVMGVALKLCENELNDYSAWRVENGIA